METGLEGKPWYYGAGVAAVLAGGIVAAGYFGKFETMQNQYERQESKLVDLQGKIREGEAAERQLSQFEEEVKGLELELEKLLRILPSRRKTEDLLRRIRNLTEQGDFLLMRFNPRSISQQDDFFSEWSIQIELEGTYHNLALFFDRVSNFARIINIENLRITPTRDTAHHTIRAVFLAKTFLSNEGTEGEEEL